MTALLVATLMANRPSEATEPLSRPPGEADFLELRLDALQTPDPATVSKLLRLPRSIPVIATCRAESQGGRFSGSNAKRLDLLRTAAEEGADFLDLEDGELDDLPDAVPGERIASTHLSRFVPRLSALAQRIAQRGAQFGKLAVPASDPSQLMRLLHLQEEMGSQFAVVPTGPIALAGRVMCLQRGAALCYGAVHTENPGHPDQPSFAQLREIYHPHLVRPSTRFYAVIGKPIGHSHSPAFHNAVFRATGTDARFVPLEVGGVAAVLTEADDLHLDGIAVTHPLKEEAVEIAASALPDSEATGAANTLVRTDLGWQARNTDWKAGCDLLPRLLRNWRRKHEGRIPRVLLMGSGGAARALAVSLFNEEIEMAIWSRTASHAQALADFLSPPLSPTVVTDLESYPADLVINATPIGMPGVDPHPENISAQIFNDGGLSVDLAYGSADSPFQKAAKEAGAHLTTGVDFFLLQAKRQAEVFLQQSLPPEVLKQGADAVRQKEAN